MRFGRWNQMYADEPGNMICVFNVLYLKTLSMAKVIRMERRWCMNLEHCGMRPTGKPKYSEINLLPCRQFPPLIPHGLPCDRTLTAWAMARPVSSVWTIGFRLCAGCAGRWDSWTAVKTRRYRWRNLLTNEPSRYSEDLQSLIRYLLQNRLR